ncbi:MGMT family protein [Candidatus Saccharibacteria bacterium]|nr:MGMT family protein [Candidatus Saccharibacteria bacterium]
MADNLSLRQVVEAYMARVPAGAVTTYGDLAALAGQPTAARLVGGIAHTGNEQLPWHRLVNSRGKLAAGYPGGRRTQQQLLEKEGVSCTDFLVDDFDLRRWRPR